MENSKTDDFLFLCFISYYTSRVIGELNPGSSYKEDDITNNINMQPFLSVSEACVHTHCTLDTTVCGRI